MHLCLGFEGARGPKHCWNRPYCRDQNTVTVFMCHGGYVLIHMVVVTMLMQLASAKCMVCISQLLTVPNTVIDGFRRHTASPALLAWSPTIPSAVAESAVFSV